MRNEILSENENQSVEGQENNQELLINIESLSEEEILLESLPFMEPQAGEQVPAIDLEYVLKVLQSIEPVELKDINDIGPIDETEKGFSNNLNNLEIFNYEAASIDGGFAVFLLSQARIFENADFIVIPVPRVIEIPRIETPEIISPPPVEAIAQPPQADIKVSNKTSSQRFINNKDHYELEFSEFSKNMKVDSETMDISGVPQDAFIRYNFKSETSFNAVLKTDWNDVKNIEVASNDLTNVSLRNFVHTDVNLSNDDGVKVQIRDAKRGFIETADGDDTINIKALSNGSGWSNRFEIDSAGGDDVIKLRGSKGHSIFDIDAGEGNDIVRIRGDYEQSNVDLGNGRDRFVGRDATDIVVGGEGNDHLRGHGGNDILIGGANNLPTYEAVAVQVDFTFIKSIAGYKNTFGVYEIAEDGTILNPSIIFENVKDNPSGTTHTEIYDNAIADISTFILANGYNKNGRFNDIDFGNGDLNLIYNFGESDERLANINDNADSVSLVFTNSDGMDVVLKGYDYHQTIGLNHDGKDHVQENVISDSKTALNFEDLPNLGDRDFRDVVIEMEETQIYETDYTVIGQDNDVLRGGKGNDILMGGAGNDKVFGDQDIDIAVFMGTLDEYIISTKGNKIIIEDTVENRDGVDTLKGVEGILFGLEDYLVENNDPAIDNFDVLFQDDLLQDAINDFVNQTNQGNNQNVEVVSGSDEFAIMHIDNVNETTDIIL